MLCHCPFNRIGIIQIFKLKVGSDFKNPNTSTKNTISTRVERGNILVGRIFSTLINAGVQRLMLRCDPVSASFFCTVANSWWGSDGRGRSVLAADLDRSTPDLRREQINIER